MILTVRTASVAGLTLDVSGSAMVYVGEWCICEFYYYINFFAMYCECGGEMGRWSWVISVQGKEMEGVSFGKKYV